MFLLFYDVYAYEFCTAVPDWSSKQHIRNIANTNDQRVIGLIDYKPRVKVCAYSEYEMRVTAMDSEAITTNYAYATENTETHSTITQVHDSTDFEQRLPPPPTMPPPPPSPDHLQLTVLSKLLASQRRF